LANEDVHIILRGGSGGPNYDAVSVDKVARGMEKSGLKANMT
jgi:3-deoxy-7-phosphoheptulonate synthase